jgi:hypothetical protein
VAGCAGGVIGVVIVQRCVQIIEGRGQGEFGCGWVRNSRNIGGKLLDEFGAVVAGIADAGEEICSSQWLL